MKRDIKINIQELEKIRSKIQTYIGYLEQLESASNTFLETIKDQDSQAYEKLSGMWEEDVMAGESLVKERFDTINRVLGNYICDMESYIAPKDPAVIMRVDRDDINWNYNQIVEHTKSIWDILMDTGSSWADYQKVFFYNPFEDGETNEARKRAVEAEVSAERARRESNYAKLEEFRNLLLKASTENISEHVAAIHAVYNDKVIPFEDRDDHYKKVMDGHYDDWKSFGDGLWDIGVVVGNAFEGVFGTVVETLVGIKDLLVGLGEICLWGLLQSMTVDVPGMVPEWLDEDVSAIGNGVTGILKDPGNALEAMGQDMFDMVDEKGIAYSVGYVATDLIIGKVIDKNLGKLGKAGKLEDAAEAAGNVAKVADDVAKAAEILDNADDVVIKVGSEAIEEVTESTIKVGAEAVEEAAERTLKSGSYSSLRDLMSPEEAARYDGYWNNVADDMLKSNLGDYRRAVLSGDITKTTRGKINSKVVTAAIDTNTGDIYYGISGMNNNPTRNMTNPQMQEILNSVNESMTNYPLENCGEFNAINNALNNGANIQNLRVYSIDRVSGNYKAPCINCQNLYGNIVHFTE